ncbi:MAG: tyrosine-protein phosphatase [Treponema sp.]|nr:tyrosine-protein phosphatase [Treponema sp.]
MNPEQITNFREVKTGKIAAGVLYRSSNPLKGRDDIGIKGELSQKAGVGCIINLDDASENLEFLSQDIPWYYKLVKEKNVIGLNMNLHIPSAYFNKKLKDGIQFMINREGPYLIHCFAGVDRAGFVVALLEALMGATIKEICDDYLLSFQSEYTSSSNVFLEQKERHLLNQFKKINHGKTVNDENILSSVKDYLLHDVGLSNDELEKLTDALRL